MTVERKASTVLAIICCFSQVATENGGRQLIERDICRVHNNVIRIIMHTVMAKTKLAITLHTIVILDNLATGSDVTGPDIMGNNTIVVRGT